MTYVMARESQDCVPSVQRELEGWQSVRKLLYSIQCCMLNRSKRDLQLSMELSSVSGLEER